MKDPFSHPQWVLSWISITTSDDYLKNPYQKSCFLLGIYHHIIIFPVSLLPHSLRILKPVNKISTRPYSITYDGRFPMSLKPMHSQSVLQRSFCSSTPTITFTCTKATHFYRQQQHVNCSTSKILTCNISIASSSLAPSPLLLQQLFSGLIRSLVSQILVSFILSYQPFPHFLSAGLDPSYFSYLLTSTLNFLPPTYVRHAYSTLKTANLELTWFSYSVFSCAITECCIILDEAISKNESHYKTMTSTLNK